MSEGEERPTMAKVRNESTGARKSKASSEIRNDGGFFTGPALVGAATFVYSAGKDAASKYWPKSKLFLQVLDSTFVDTHHLVWVRMASAHLHALHIERIKVEGVNIEDLGCYPIEKAKIRLDTFEPPRQQVLFPIRIAPTDHVELVLHIPQTQREPTKTFGVQVNVCFASLDSLGKPEILSADLRLRWD